MADLSAQTPIRDLLKLDHFGTMEVLAEFRVVHCAGCEVDESRSIEQLCAEKQAPLKQVLNALRRIAVKA